MRMHITPTLPHRSSFDYMYSLGLGAVFIVISVFHLFKFEELADALRLCLPDTSTAGTEILAALLVVGEVFAVAYFLPVLLSKLARTICGLLAVIVPLSWLSVFAASHRQWSDQPEIMPTMFGISVMIWCIVWSLLFIGVIYLVMRDVRHLRARH